MYDSFSCCGGLVQGFSLAGLSADQNWDVGNTVYIYTDVHTVRIYVYVQYVWLYIDINIWDFITPTPCGVQPVANTWINDIHSSTAPSFFTHTHTRTYTHTGFSSQNTHSTCTRVVLSLKLVGKRSSLLFHPPPFIHEEAECPTTRWQQMCLITQHRPLV